MRECGPDCTETLLEVEAFLDGEVDRSLAERITSHLSDCSGCADKAEFRKHLKEVLASRCIERDVPAALKERIRTLIADA